ncbi:MAG: hypothetical protein RBT76_09090 [candidate division Zixibacteria bacterium]|jgi:hypothetical protein|nr:hypothetical protein [candidate division Zixibacteria bacterium]
MTENHSNYQSVRPGRKALPLGLALLFTVVSCLCNCSQSNESQRFKNYVQSHAVSSTEAYILDALTRNRVVLLGDNAHGQWQPRETVIDGLLYWFALASADSVVESSIPRDLSLVLELDSLSVGRVEKYMVSGDPSDILTLPLICSGVFTTADLEFFDRLGQLRARVNAFNQKASDDRRISFAVLPGEPTIDRATWSFDKRSYYFMHERDSLVARRIESLLSRPGAGHLLLFYGEAHLQKGKVTKRADDKEFQGLYLASYLDSALPDSFMTIGQVTPDYWGVWRNDFATNTAAYALPISGVKEKVGAFVSGPHRYDAVIVHNHRVISGTPILQIPSMNVTRLCVQALDSIVDPEDDFSRAYWPLLLPYLNAVSGQLPHRLDLNSKDALADEAKAWSSWLISAPHSVAPKVADLTMYTGILDRLSQATGPLAGRYDHQFTSLLPDSPALERGDNMPTPAERASQLRQFLHANSEEIVIHALIELLWVGSKEERDEAESLLRQCTGVDVGDRSAWSEWYRTKNVPPSR